MGGQPRARRPAILLSLCLCLCGACASEKERKLPPVARGKGVSLHAVLEASRDVQVGTLRLGEVPPALVARCVRFRGALELTSREPLDQPYVLECFPFVESPTGAGASARVYAIDAGEKTLLAQSEPFDSTQPPGRSPPRHELLDRPQVVDLTPLAGRVVRLRWEIGDPAAEIPAGLAALRLAPIEASELPPILIVCSDAHRYDFSVGAVGSELMPNLTHLRESSVVYRHAWSNASWTLPSITTVLTGLPPRYHRTGLKIATGLREALAEREPVPGTFVAPWAAVYHEITAYPDELETLPEILSALGYTTVLISANPFYQLSGLAQDGHDFFVEATGRSGKVLNDEMRLLLKRLSAERPLYVTVHFMDVHDFVLWQFSRQHPQLHLYAADPEQIRTAYREAVQDSDRYLGSLLEAWDERIGLARTLLVFYADHGEHLLDPGHPVLADALADIPADLPQGLRNVTVPVLNHGNSMQESLLRIPLVVKYPAGTSTRWTSGVIDAPVSLVDVLPTVLDVVGVRPAGFALAHRGRSLLAVAAEADQPPRPIFADYQLYGPPLASVRRGEMKLVWDPLAGSVELRRVCLSCRPDGDPGEAVTEEELRRSLLADLREHTDEALTATADLRSAHRVPDEKVIEELEALGYVR